MLNGSFILRVGLSLVFAYFAAMQVIDPTVYTDYLPADLQGANATMFVYANALLDAVLAITILLRIFPRITPAVAAVHLAAIAFTMGFNDIAVRDYGLAIAALSLVFIKEEHIPLKQRLMLNKLFP